MSAIDTFSAKDRTGGDADLPPGRGFAITPSDDDELPYVTRAIYVGGTGDINVRLLDRTSLTFKSAPIGTLLIRCRQVMDTGTTATDLIGLY